jgi:hypothetical protein
MARRIEGPYDFSQYGFITYADGATWLLTKNEDYQVSGKTVLANARKWARQEGLEIDYKIVESESHKPEQIALRFRRKVRPIAAVND